MSDVIEIDAATGEVVERPFTTEERAQQETDALAEAERIAAAEQAEAERVAGIQSAQTELKALGLSDAAVAAISGQPYPYAG